MMKSGASGPDVVKLQERLKELCFNPGDIDGDFGLATEASVIAFQKSEGLLADGVAGPRTLAAMGLAEDNTLPAVIDKVTVAIVSKMFPHTPLDNIKKYLPVVLKALAEQGLTDKPMVLMALATIRAETEGFEPISERQSRYNTSPGGHPFNLYDFRRDLGNGAYGDGEQFRGRGFIQLTGKSNYLRYGYLIGEKDGLVTEPERANYPRIAARLLASFLSEKERAIKEALLDNNLRLARKLVNGGSHGLNRFVEAYQIGDRLIA